MSGNNNNNTIAHQPHKSADSEDLLAAPINDQMPPIEQQRRSSTSDEDKPKQEVSGHLDSREETFKKGSNSNSSNSGKTPSSKLEDEEDDEEGPRSGVVAAVSILCTLLQFVVFVLVVVATPLDMYKERPNRGNLECLSMWGKKPCGGKLNYKGLSYRGFACKGVYRLMIGGAASSICAIVMTFVTFLLTLITATGCSVNLQGTTAAAMCSMMATTFTLVTFAFVSGARNKGCGFNSGMGYNVIRTNYQYAAGYGLITSAFCIQFVTMVLLLAVMCL